jgi:hypothetical protein
MKLHVVIYLIKVPPVALEVTTNNTIDNIELKQFRQ